MKRRTLIPLLIFMGLGTATAVGGRSHSVPSEPLSPGAKNNQNPSADSDSVLLRFAAVGDVGTGDRAQYKVARAMEARWQETTFSLVLLTGDNIYPNGDIASVSDVFDRPYAKLLQNNVVFRAVLGNHDFRTNEGNDEVEYAGYNMPARYYTFTEGPAQFFAIDTNLASIPSRHGEAQWRDQIEWLAYELKKSRSAWKVVFAHHPVYSSGFHGSDHKLIADLSPIFKTYGVQLYVNGHDHNYERTDQIAGTTYITSGNGANLRPVGSSRWTAYASSQLGFNLFELYDNRMVIKAIDVNNAVYDESAIALN